METNNRKLSFSKKCVAFLIGIAMLLSAVITPMAASYVGDLNGDNAVSAPDLVTLKTVLLLGDTDLDYDVNGDGVVNIIDLVRLKKMLAQAKTEVTAPVKSIDGKVSESVTLSAGGVSAFVPAGVLLEDGVSSLTLTVIPLTSSGIPAGENEKVSSYDVHISGISKDNTVPVIIDLGAVMPKYLNMGNYKIYHVENGENKLMTLVDSREDLKAHNQFTYEPETGKVTIAMSSFSEVAMVSNEINAWNGSYDYNFKGDGTEANPYIISTADELAGLGAIVGGMNEQNQNSYSGKFFKLISDINLGDAEENNDPDKIFYPIGYNSSDGKYEKTGEAITSGFYTFEGTFDGNGHTISNIYQNTWEMKGDHDWYTPEDQYYRDGMGIFGKVYGGTVKNLTVDNFKSDGEIATTGVIAAYADSANGKPAVFENIAITNCNPRVYNIGNGGIVGCVGWYSKDESLSNDGNTNAVTFRNITVDQTNKISALWGSYDVSCGGLVGQYYPNSGCGIKFENCHVSAIMDVYNDVCANYQYYWYRYSGMLIGTVRANTTEGGYTVADTTGITATDCTYTLGDWNEYWYCELVKNSLASYTHDHQFSRLTKIASESEIKDENGDWNQEGNFVIPAADNSSATCYHIFRNSEGKLYQHFHDEADESNTDIYETSDLNGDGELNDLKEDRICYFMPFNQILNGLGYGVKAHYEFDGMENVVDGTVKSSQKFESSGTVTTYRPGQTITLGNLFNSIVDDSKLSKPTIYAFVSPATEEDNISATYSLDLSDWQNSTLTFAEDCEGSAKITITDYFYCTPTVIYLDPEQTTEKFTAKPVDIQSAYSQITLGDIFTAKENVTIGNVTATVTDPNGTETTVSGTSADWASKTIDLTYDGEWTIVIKDDDNYCAITETTFTVRKTDKFEKKFKGDFLYRVGNQNKVTLSYLFSETETPVGLSSVNVTIENVAGNAAGTFTSSATWTNGTIEFSGTGVVKVTISANGANPVELNLEVVDATNVTTYSELKEQNSVLLNNITMTSGGTYRLTGNKTLYGNGYTFDVKSGAYAGVEYDYASYVIYLENSRLDNIKIEGAVYPNLGGSRTDDYNRAIVMSSGDCLISNSYISNGASPIRNGGNLELINTTLKGGVWANLDLRNGHLILDNVTTINQIGANDKYNENTEIIGMGIVVYLEGGTEELKITIENELTQYNYLSETDADKYLTNTYASQIKDIVFSNDFASYKNGELINFGIVSMNNLFTEDDIVDNRIDTKSYFGTSKTVTLLGQSRDCYVYSFKPSTTDIPEYMGYNTAGQGIISPTVAFDFTEKNYQQKVEGINDYCYADGKIVYISMDEGDTFNWDTSILTATKNGYTLDYTVTMNEADYTNKSIAFNTTGTYEIEYDFTDNYNYSISNNNVEMFGKNYTETLIIEVSVVKPDAKNAEFSFGANGTAYSSKTVLIGDKTYVMPNVTATVSGKIGSTTVNGTTVYYPITEMYTSDGKTEHTGNWYACFPIFKDALQIIDYADKGTGDAVTYNQEKVTTVAQIPSTLKATNPTSAFLYSMNATNYPPPTDPTAVSGAVCYTCNRNGLTASNERNEMTITAEYTYTDNAGTVYYYYIGYHCAKQTSGSCVTPDTLVTLADGSQVRVDSLTGDEMLLVWNLETGTFDTAPIMFVDSEEENEFEVIKLYFSDGTEVKVISEHGFWDYDLNKYVYLDRYAENYIGHTFAKHNGTELVKVQLVDVVLEMQTTSAWSPVTVGHLCYFVNGMLSMPGGVGGLFNIFDVDAETLTYDYDSIAKDIETYGLYTYEELNAIAPLSEEMFYAAGGQYLKISIGKGNLTIEELKAMINRYSNFI